MENILEVKKLVKNFGSFRAVDGISFVVPRGGIIGLLGPNGAGKTTTINILLGLTSADSGTISYFGQDFFTHREKSLQKINFASSYNTLQGRISVWENLLVFAHLYQITNPKKKILDLVEYFEVGELLNKRFWDLSAGQRTRANLIKSLLNDPELILMDEPTASLDPDIADKTLSLIEELKKERDLSLLFTSHNMDEITRICDEVIFLDHGRIVAQDTPLGLTKRIASAELRLIFEGDQKPIIKILQGFDQPFKFQNKNTVLVDTTEKLIPQIIYKFSEEKINITDIEVFKPTLEDVFLQIARGEKHVP
jgi:ABC-2 type transport system ATP-binding protein